MSPEGPEPSPRIFQSLVGMVSVTPISVTMAADDEPREVGLAYELDVDPGKQAEIITDRDERLQSVAVSVSGDETAHVIPFRDPDQGRSGRDPTRRVCDPNPERSIRVLEHAPAPVMSGAVQSPEKGDVCGDPASSPNTGDTITDSLMDSMQCVQTLLLPNPVPVELVALGPETIAHAVRDARKLLGTDIIYDDEFYRTHDIPDIEVVHYEANDQALLSESLESILEKSISRKKLQGMEPEKLREYFHGISQLDRVIEILTDGERPFMREGFKPNGGRECTLSRSYKERRRLCNMAMRKLADDGRVVVFSKDALVAAGQMHKIHDSPLTWVDKPDTWEGRTCNHLSKGSRNFPSINSSIDDKLSDAHYPMTPLPLLPDIAEMACRQRDANPGKPLSGATVDVKSAFHQFPKSVAAAILVAATIQVVDKSRPGGTKELVVVYGFGQFGHKKAGNVYGVLGNAIREKHNLGCDVPRSETYVDDGILISPDDELDESLREYIEAVVALFGPYGVNKKKVNRWNGKLEAIGWDLCFRRWRVQPKIRGLSKMLVLLFDVIPPGTRIVEHRHLERLQGLLMWYASGIPAGKSFIASLFKCGETTHGNAALSRAAQQDLDWWRALVWVAYHVPQVLGADLDAVRRFPTPTRFLRTDASSEIGGGGVASLTMGGPAIDLPGAQIRWTRAELEAFRNLGISINVLEYFAAMFYIIVWAEEFENRVIHVECDNTAAVSWLMKSRANGQNATANALAQIFTLFLLRHRISLFCTHLAGVKNVVADFNSRDLFICPQEADEGIVDGHLSSNSNRRDCCRNLLYNVVVRPETILGQRLVTALTILDTGHGRPTVESWV